MREPAGIQVCVAPQEPSEAPQEPSGARLTYAGMGWCCRKVSGSGVSSRGQSFLPALLPNELRSFLASFFGVLTSVRSSSTAQLHSATLSSNSGTASLLRNRTHTICC